MPDPSPRLFSFALSALLLAACGGEAPPSGSPPPDPDEAPDVLRVALLTPGSIRDAGWNQSAYEGLVEIRDRLGAEVAYQETATPQDFEAGFRDFAARGYDLVFGHGFEFQDAAALVGKEYPDTVFVTTSGSTVTANVSPIVFELEQATFVLGFLGARISQSGRVGAVGGIEIPSVASTFYAFEKGAERGGATTSISYTGSWTDVSAAREATLAQISQGVDVLIHNANEGARGFFQAVNESDGVWAYGANRNQNALSPEHVLASATLNVPRALLLVATEVAEDRFEGRALRFGLSSGVVAIEWNDSLAPGVMDARAEGLQDEVAALVAQIESGELTVPRGEF
ncbi:MAG: BMP family protein [Deltaproteobacteria bacterium]|nr:BMP family protein [Deltaproteobacteria bacterium]MBW2416804.1 BMP family protein [Deltaproteobacteria bacterium]